jgi:hypothetical protein
MEYQSPSIRDYGDLEELTAERVMRQRPDAEFPSEDPPQHDDTTGPLGPPFP